MCSTAPLRKTPPHDARMNEDWRDFPNLRLKLSGKKHKLWNDKYRLHNIWYRLPRMTGWHAWNKNCKMQVLESPVLFLKSDCALWDKACACLLWKRAQQYENHSNCRLCCLYFGLHGGWFVMDLASFKCCSWILVVILRFNPITPNR